MPTDTDVVSLTVLDFGRADIDLGVVMAPGDADGMRAMCAFPGYLIELRDGRRVLVDTGPNRALIGQAVSDYRPDHFPPRLAEYLIPHMTPADDPLSRLAGLGLTPADIDILLLTHTHFDHAGNAALFKDSRIVIHRDAFDTGQQWRKEGSAAGIPETSDDGTPLRYDIIEGQTDLAPGLTLLETPGHAPGHLSVLLRLPDTGPVILAIDAIYSKLNRDSSNYKIGADPEQGARSAEQLLDIERREGAWTIYGHDPEQWEQLKKAPEKYT